jgi:hypothetical protein
LPRWHGLGIPLPKPNLKPDYEEQSRAFVDGLVGSVLERRPAAVTQT